MRDHRKFHEFELADDLGLAVYSATKTFPQDSARNSEADFLRFLEMAFGAIREVEYQLRIARRLGYTDEQIDNTLAIQADETASVLAA